jgi:hypothetical protein
MAVRVGFEPTEPVKVQRFSRPPDSTALAPHRTHILPFPNNVDQLSYAGFFIEPGTLTTLSLRFARSRPREFCVAIGLSYGYKIGASRDATMCRNLCQPTSRTLALRAGVLEIKAKDPSLGYPSPGCRKRTPLCGYRANRAPRALIYR